jgi:hypothetical protein
MTLDTTIAAGIPFAFVAASLFVAAVAVGALLEVFLEWRRPR